MSQSKRFRGIIVWVLLVSFCSTTNKALGQRYKEFYAAKGNFIAAYIPTDTSYFYVQYRIRGYTKTGTIDQLRLVRIDEDYNLVEKELHIKTDNRYFRPYRIDFVDQATYSINVNSKYSRFFTFSSLTGTIHRDGVNYSLSGEKKVYQKQSDIIKGAKSSIKKYKLKQIETVELYDKNSLLIEDKTGKAIRVPLLFKGSKAFLDNEGATLISSSSTRQSKIKVIRSSDLPYLHKGKHSLLFKKWNSGLIVEKEEVALSAKNYIERGKSSLESKDYLNARLDFEQALKLDPKNNHLHYLISKTYLINQRYDIQYWDELFYDRRRSIDNAVIDLLTRRGKSKLKYLDQKLDHLKKALISPGEYEEEILSDLIKVHLVNTDVDEVIQLYNQHKDILNTDIRVAAAMVFARKLNDAKVFLSNLHSNKPDALTFYYLGQIDFLEKRFGDARLNFAKSYELDKNSRTAYNIGVVSVSLGDSEMSCSAFALAFNDYPKSTHYYLFKNCGYEGELVNEIIPEGAPGYSPYETRYRNREVAPTKYTVRPYVLWPGHEKY